MTRFRRGDVVESPNIWRWPEVYERENAAQDATGALWDAVCELAPHDGADVVDVGCGDGYHLPRFAERARSVVGVEPHAPLVARARERVTEDPACRVEQGSAAALPLDDDSADVVHARTAYFFGPGCEPGLAEASRVLRPGGVLVIVDLDATRHSYGAWMRASAPRYDPERPPSASSPARASPCAASTRSGASRTARRSPTSCASSSPPPSRRRPSTAPPGSPSRWATACTRVASPPGSCGPDARPDISVHPYPLT